MWAGDDDLNEDGKPVRLYQPIPYGRKPAMGNLTCSFVGGVAGSGSPRSSSSSDDDDDDDDAPPTIPSCASCSTPLHSLVQLHVPETNRTLQVFACNRLACVQGLFSPPTAADSTRTTSSTNGTTSSSTPGDGDKDSSRDMLCYGGGGVVVCRRLAAVVEDEKSSSSVSHLPSSTTATTIDEKPRASTSDWVVEEEDDTKKSTVDNSNEWAVAEDGDDVGAVAAGTSNGAMDDLESKLAAMETKTKKLANPKTQKVSTATDEKKQTPASLSSSSSHFPCLELYSIQEPPALRRAVDQDDVGMMGSGGGRGTDDRKIQQMLAKYMQEEEDQDLLAVLRGSGVDGGGGKGVGGGERDERLSATDRALLTFSDRLKRSPRQVLRYAHGGAPLWSM